MTLFNVAHSIQAQQAQDSQVQNSQIQTVVAAQHPWYRRPPIVAIALLLASGVAIYAIKPWASESTQDTSVITAPAPTTVSALGFIEPQGEAIAISAPSTSQNSRVEQLLVSRGDTVKAGQVIAIMDQQATAAAALAAAREDERIAQVQLAQVLSGEKQGDIAAQRSEIARLEADQQASIAAQRATVDRLDAEFRNAEIENQRYESLYQDGAISASERDSKRLTLESAQRNLQNATAELDRQRTTRSPQLAAAQSTLDAISEVRPVDVDLAEAEVGKAMKAVEQAEAELEQAYVRSPQAGVVLEVFTRPGEKSNSDGIVEIGQLDQMIVTAEVYESDIQRVEVGQSALITSRALSQALVGTVTSIGSKIQQQDIIPTDPSATIDARVVEVEIRLDADSTTLAHSFTNLQVNVEIEQ
ncbi:MAG: ABC exporter membrane fusion protein [Elainellaceae cyanobacterium]